MFTDLPPDVLRSIALKMSFETLQNYCSTSSAFRRLCQDEYFWRDLIRRDYPAVSEDFLQTIAPASMRDFYLSKKRDELTNIVLRRRFEDPDQRRTELSRQIDVLQQEINQIDENRKKDTMMLLNQIKVLSNTIPFDTYPPQYTEVLVERSQLHDLDVEVSTKIYTGVAPNEIQDYLNETYNLQPPLLINVYDLIGVRDELSPETDRPELLLYTTLNNDLPVMELSTRTEFPSSLNRDAVRRGWTSSDVQRIYNLPFDLGPIGVKRREESNFPTTWEDSDED